MLASKILPRAVERFPDSVAVVCGGRTFTYRELGDGWRGSPPPCRASGCSPGTVLLCCMTTATGRSRSILRWLTPAPSWCR